MLVLDTFTACAPAAVLLLFKLFLFSLSTKVAAAQQRVGDLLHPAGLGPVAMSA
jgi:hypothetical protein